nr:hypothetical protein [Tanacetum cinerariifolium]
MSTSTHPIIIPSDYDIEDVFSSAHSPNYIPASPDYFLASPRNTFSDPSKDLSKYLLASLAISYFYDHPYMKVMQAYNATSNEPPIPPQAPITPPTVLPSPPVNEPVLDHPPLFLPYLKYSILEKSSHKMHLEHQRDFDQLETELQEARTQIAKLQREQIGHNDEIVLARVRISTLEMIIEDIQVCHRSDMKSLLDKICELKNHKGGPPGY